jgi:pyruvate ferredoxin oxidoreductase gamma subunit
MEDQLANPLNGIDEFTNIFINSRHTPEELKAHYDLPSLPIAVNLTDACMRHLGAGAILSVALAAAVCRMTMQIRFGPLLKSVRLELEELGIGRKMIVKNFNLAREIFKAVTPRLLPSRNEEEVLQPSELIEMELKPAVEGAPVILSTGNMGIKKTGNWRVHRPEINYAACNGCLICFIRCPDGVIGLMDDVKPAIDYDHCKGCLICVEECPTHCIEVLREEPSWT